MTRCGRSRIESLRKEPPRSWAYRRLSHPFVPQTAFSDDAVNKIHETALRVLEELGMRILLPEARLLFAAAGAIVDEDNFSVRIGRDIIAACLTSAPRATRMRAASPEREQMFALGSLLFTAGAGSPNAHDLPRGRRPGTLRDYEEALKLQQAFDVIHKFSPSAEPQDVPAILRHCAMIKSQLTIGDKPMFLYSQGRRQVEESFEIIRLALDLTDQEFTDGAWATTIVNTNSPRQLDIPMAEGIVDFARARQLCVITPFCLAGAMAPVTVAGALVLQHAEALACIALSQTACRGAPVAYGGFSSNVDMKSGAPAFGTPEHVSLSLGSGQLARHIGMPWRSAAGSASNAADMQAAGETHMSLWGSMLANATLIVHGAGWLEGGLTFGYEKFINDVEALQTLAVLCQSPGDDEGSLGWDALEEVNPGGHFFGAEHTMQRYRDAFYPPLVADLGNFGSWQEAGGKTSTERAVAIWKSALAAHSPPPHTEVAVGRIKNYIARRTAAGGAPPAGG